MGFQGLQSYALAPIKDDFAVKPDGVLPDELQKFLHCVLSGSLMEVKCEKTECVNLSIGQVCIYESSLALLFSLVIIIF